MTDEKQFFVGIGAHRAGTTWLGDYLQSHPQVFMSPLKELHYFNARFLPELFPNILDQFLVRLRYHASKIRTGKEFLNIQMVKFLLKRVEMATDPIAYTEFFPEFCENEIVFGEITPAYSLLDREGFHAIVNAYPNAKFIFVLRNPVDRYWSHIKLHVENNNRSDLKKEFYCRFEDPQFFLRSNYTRTLEELGHAVSRENILVLFFENVFSEKGKLEIEKLLDFLSIDYFPPKFSNKLNNTSNESVLTGEDRDFAIEQFSDVYQYIFENHHDDYPESWSKDKKILGRIK